MGHFICQQKVLFQHCDPAGIVFYPRYFEMLNRTVEEWFEERLGHGFVAIHGDMRAAVPTVRIEIDFRAVSRHGDRLDFILVPRRIGGASMDISIDVVCAGETRLTMQSRLVFFSQTEGRAKPWPDRLRAAIETELKQAGETHA